MVIYGFKIRNKLNPAQFAALAAHLDTAKRERISRFIREEDRYRALLGGILARVAICNILDISNKAIVLADNGYGKPVLKGYPEFHFNIAHSGEWVVCIADHSNHPAGIDVERIKPADFKIARRFFSRDEYNDLQHKEYQEKLSYFYDLWTLKESYIKAVGKGLSIPLNSFSVRITENKCRSQQQHIQIQINDPAMAGVPEKTFFFRQYHIDRDYKLSACSTNHNFPDQLIML